MCSGFLDVRVAALVAGVLLLCGCRDERKHVTLAPPSGAPVLGVRQTELQPGPPAPARRVKNPFEGNAHALAEGKRLYNAFNCSGCHFNGGGGIGPPLMDDAWIYGSSPANIYSTVVEGRPQGMPAFGGRIVEYQLWQIVAYVRSMSDSTDSPSSGSTDVATQQQAPQGDSR